MKKIMFFLFSALLLTGCEIIPSQVEEGFSFESICDSNCSTTPSKAVVAKGGTVKISITYKEGYIGKKITVNGDSIAVPSDNIISLSNVNSDLKVEITSKKKEIIVVKNFFTISSLSGSNGTITPLGDVKIEEGKDSTYSIVSNPGYEIDKLIVDGVIVPSTSSYKFSNVTCNHKIEVTFKKILANFTISASSGSNGTITPSGIVTVTEGQDKEFSIIPDGGYDVDQLTVDGNIVSPKTYYKFSNVSTNHTILPTFKKTLKWNLIQGNWTRDSIYIRTNGVWDYYKSDLEEVIYFYADGKSKTYWGGKYVGDPNWLLNETVKPMVLMRGNTFQVELLTENKMVLYDYSQGFGLVYTNHR